MRRNYVLKNNKLASSVHYGTILKEYNKVFDAQKEKGKRVNDGEFWKNFIIPLIPDYQRQSWYYFLRKFKTQAGLTAAYNTDLGREIAVKEERGLVQEDILGEKLLTNEVATSQGIRKALNIGKEAFDLLVNHPEELSVKERAAIFFQAMKAQDSRIHALGRVKEDAREDMKMRQAFEQSAYGDE